MPHYLFHLRNGSDELLHPEGIELPADAVPGAALMAARDCMAGDLMKGKLNLRLRIDVHDEAGQLVQTVQFADAVEVVLPD